MQLVRSCLQLASFRVHIKINDLSYLIVSNFKVLLSKLAICVHFQLVHKFESLIS